MTGWYSQQRKKKLTSKVSKVKGVADWFGSCKATDKTVDVIRNKKKKKMEVMVDCRSYQEKLISDDSKVKWVAVWFESWKAADNEKTVGNKKK